MDYTIIRTVDAMPPRTVHTFTQTATAGHAKTTAKHRLLAIWARIASRPDIYLNHHRSPDEVSYDYRLTPQRTVHVRFSITPARKKDMAVAM